MLKKIFITFLILIILFFIYFKIRYRFWSSQPVFHIFNLKQWILPSGIIQHKLQQKQKKFFNYKIKSNLLKTHPTEKKALFYYLINPNLSKNQFLSFYNSGFNRTYVSHFLDYNSIPISDGSYHLSKKLMGCVFSKTLNSIILNKKVKVAFINDVTVHSSVKDKSYEKNRLFYTHYYQSRLMGAPPIHLFKVDGHLPYLTPCTVFYTYEFDTKYIDHANFNMPNNISIKKINSGNFNLFVHFYSQIKEKYLFITVPDFLNLKTMVASKLYIPFIVLDKTTPVAILFFKKNKSNITLCSSCIFPKYYSYLMIILENCLFMLKKNNTFSNFYIENISDNYLFIKKLLKKKMPKEKQIMNYYFYNFSIRPFISNKCFIIT